MRLFCFLEIMRYLGFEIYANEYDPWFMENGKVPETEDEKVVMFR